MHVEPRLCDTKRVRPDLDILLPDVNMMLDVAVTHPGAPSRKSDRRFAAADDIQATKNRHYKDWALARGGRFFSFVYETHGALGRQAEAVLKLLASGICYYPAHVRSRLHEAHPPGSVDHLAVRQRSGGQDGRHQCARYCGGG